MAAARDGYTTANRGLAGRISLGYALIAGLWIYASDTLLDEMSTVLASGARLQIYKDWLFVAVTALLLYGVVVRIAKSQVRPEGIVTPAIGEEVPRPWTQPLAVPLLSLRPLPSRSAWPDGSSTCTSAHQYAATGTQRSARLLI